MSLFNTGTGKARQELKKGGIVDEHDRVRECRHGIGPKHSLHLAQPFFAILFQGKIRWAQRLN